jgi:hypothetical protein
VDSRLREVRALLAEQLRERASSVEPVAFVSGGRRCLLFRDWP